METILFLHIPKTGGVTITELFQRVFGLRGSETYVEGNGWQNMTKAKLRKAQLCQGHFPYGMHKYVSDRYRYITILRHPAHRIASLYHYIMHLSGGAWKQWEEKVPGFYPNMPLCDFVKLPYYSFENGMTKQLCGAETHGRVGIVTPSEFKRSARHLEDFEIAFTEYYEQSVRQLFGKLGLKCDKIPHNNPGGRTKNYSLDESRMFLENDAEFMAKNSFDLELWQTSLDRAGYEIPK